MHLYTHTQSDVTFYNWTTLKTKAWNCFSSYFSLVICLIEVIFPNEDLASFATVIQQHSPKVMKIKVYKISWDLLTHFSAALCPFDTSGFFSKLFLSRK